MAKPPQDGRTIANTANYLLVDACHGDLAERIAQPLLLRSLHPRHPTDGDRDRGQ